LAELILGKLPLSQSKNHKMTTIENIEKHYQFTYPSIYKRLWEDGKLDWYKGWNEPWQPNRNWKTEVYPVIKDKPPILLHTGGDLQMLRPEAIADYEFPDWWHPEHRFVPFAETGAGDVFAFYANVNIDGDTPIVLAFHDNNEAIYLAQNFEDFIFRTMLEAVADIDENHIALNFNDRCDEFRECIQNDLRTVKLYLKPAYVTVLEQCYDSANYPACSPIPEATFQEIQKMYQTFAQIDQVFDHESEPEESS
jgi:hypothetical protein